MKHVYNDDMHWTEDAERLSKKVSSILGDTVEDALKEFSPESVYYIIDDAVKLQILRHIVLGE
jgi:hypothetical protein